MHNKEKFTRLIKTREPKVHVRLVKPSKIVLTETAPTYFTPRIIIYGFLSLIIIGTVLLMLPLSGAQRGFTSPINALFTATSSVCVTGLIVVDTGTYWSLFGQAVILVLIQLGGFGFMASITIMLLTLRGGIGLRESLLVGETLGETRLSNIRTLIKRMAIFTLIVEFVGAIIFFLRFYSQSPPGEAIWRSVFHSISAYNNAGFDIMGKFRGLVDYQSDPLLILTTALLVILGGISFVFLSDLAKAKRFNKLSLDSKFIVVTTVSLLALGTVVILVLEYFNPHTLGPLSLPDKLMMAFFHSVTTRTAGFSAIDIGMVAPYSLFFIMLLMFIGGATGSTAGGIKVNSFGLIVAAVWSSIRGRYPATAFGRELLGVQIQRVLSIMVISLGLIGIVVFILSITEKYELIEVLFETISAFGTVGLSTGITQNLTPIGKILLIITMFAGRLGPATIAVYLTRRQKPVTYEYPREPVRIG